MAESQNNNMTNPEIPELLEGVAALRKCSFKPQEHFIKIPGFRAEDEESFYLEVKWREFWFHAYCDEHDIPLRSIEELPVTQIPGTNFLQAEAIVKMNGEVAGRGVGGYLLSTGKDDSNAIQLAGTIAKGRALANAGFGTVFSSTAAKETGGQEIVCDSGLRTSEFFVRRCLNNPMVMTLEKNENPIKAEKETAAPAPTAEAKPEPPREPAPAPKPAMTREEALTFTVPIRGKHFCEALGDVMGKDPSAVRYYAENPRYAGKEIQEAAKLVLNH